MIECNCSAGGLRRRAQGGTLFRGRGFRTPRGRSLAGEGYESSCAGHRSKETSTSYDCPWITGHEASATRPSTLPPGEGPGPYRTVNGESK
jgi:hypothetical protein